MNGKQHQQMQARINLTERQLRMYEKANAQLEGTLATFTLIMASIALRNGGTYKIPAADIDAAGGAEFRIEKNEDEQAIVLICGDKQAKEETTVLDPDSKEELPFDPGKPPSKLEHPFIMEEEGLNPPEMGQSAIKLTDL